MATIEETFAMMFANPNPGKCYLCGKTEDLEPAGGATLIGDEPWMICATCKAELAEKERKDRDKKAEMEARIDFIESMPGHRE